MRKFLALAMIMAFALAATSCKKMPDGVDKDVFNLISGDYQVVAEENDDDYIGTWWHLSIHYDDEQGPYLSIYDNEAGNPGVEGPIVELNNDSVKIQWDPDYMDQLPSGKWKLDGDFLTMDYQINADGIELTNSGRSLQFNVEK